MSERGLLPIIQVSVASHACCSIRGAVAFLGFLGQHFNRDEPVGQAGSLQLVVLLGRVAFGDENAAVPRGQRRKRSGHAGQHFDLLFRNRVGEGNDALVLFRRYRRSGELLEAADERLPEALETVAVGGNRGSFDMVQTFAHFFVGVDAMVEVRDEGRDGALEVNIVFPQRVVGVEEQGLVLAIQGWLLVKEEEGTGVRSG